jgi:hypothetical protein
MVTRGKGGYRFGVMNKNPITRKLNFVEIKKSTTLCLEYTFDVFYILEPNNNSAYVLQKIA